jgi:hypothetical protein
VKPETAPLHTNDKTRVMLASCLLSGALLALTLGAAPALAVEQCRFIQAKPEREACYQRQEAELAAKRKPERAPDKTMEALEQMKHEDMALDRQIHSICRGC